MQLTKNFRLEELTRTGIYHIDNSAPDDIVEHLKLFCETILQPLRDAAKKPIYITSGYRCPELNTAVGGVKNSIHQVVHNGRFVGVGADITGDNLIELCQLLWNRIPVSTIIYYPNRHFIHVDVRTDPQYHLRKRFFICNQRSVYIPVDITPDFEWDSL